MFSTECSCVVSLLSSWETGDCRDDYHYLLFLVNTPVEGIRLLDTVVDKRRRVPFAAVWSQPGVVCSEKVTFDPLSH